MRLGDDEIIAQFRTLVLAGNDTTAKPVSSLGVPSHGMTSDSILQLLYVFWELARRPEIQDRLREEVTEMYEAVKARGDEDFTSEDIDNMPFTNAVVKVSPV